jgi:hypothetical protein
MPAGAYAALTWSGPTGQDTGGQGSAIAAVACPAAGTCVAVDQAGAEVVFDSGAPRATTPASIDSQSPTGLVCPSTTECAAVDGGGNEVTFNPADPSAAAAPVPIDPSESFTGLSCVPGTSTCVAVDSDGGEVTFDPRAPQGAERTTVDQGLRLVGVSCASQTVCVAIDSQDNEVTFDPGVPGDAGTASANTAQNIDSPSANLTAVTCVSDTECLAFDNAGNEIFLELQGSLVFTAAPTTVDGPGNSILAVTCLSAGQCVALDNAGNEVSFTPGQQPGQLTQVDPAANLAGIACPSTCVAGDGRGHIDSFSPTGGDLTTTLIDAQAAYSVAACPAASQCTAMDNFGDEATFDPGDSAPAPAGPVDPNADVIYGVACPSTTQCTAVDDIGQAATFSPLSPGTATVTAIVTGHPLLAVACPATDQCTAVDDDRYAATFNPQNPTGAVYTDLDTPAQTSLVGIACPTAAQCTVLDGSGDAVTFDPQAPGRMSPTRVLPGTGVGIACPTTTECVALDGNGNRATFDPATRAPATTAAISVTQPAALSCPSATYCVGLDTAGAAVEFDPHGTGATVVHAIGDSAHVADLTCPAITMCVAVDYAGAAFIGSQTVSGLPGAVTAPRVRGHLVQGALLTARQGTWRNAPTSYSPQWERCTVSGRSCRPIAGATAVTYRAVKADVGHALRVAETPANPLGNGPAVTSRVTRPIAGLPAGPVVSDVRLTDPVRGRSQLTLVLAAARYGPQLRTITVRLPAGVSITARGATDAMALIEGRRRARGVIRRLGGGFVIALRRDARSLRVRVDAPRLVVAPGLASRVRQRRVRRLVLTVAVGPAARLRTTARMAVMR